MDGACKDKLFIFTFLYAFYLFNKRVVMNTPVFICNWEMMF